ncbi:cobyrinate a,c-diamide synthase [Vibrio algarum]|uniref:Cobyrinate a,c-diamide synthase n=1 Tax=Vibrio algarum TaxID=3020714 RepID=A0ABT4YUG9_9VIBR|nr:cobyrinate a,c-diamide synthase [Vibrio sp. KJ40-1]MDB1125225.1 cobyrinate a,c-diamide synthase [Vibrio sp. KJ40-1]
MDEKSQSTTVRCPALVVAAPSSGSGKTTVVAAIARHFSNQGLKVRVFKTGPDFIDPHFLSFASGHPVYQLDFWMCGEEHCKQMVAEAAQEADLILIEGVMGMFDGVCSTADIAETLGIPILAVIDAGSMAQTFGAIAYGLANFRQEIEMYGVFANRVGSATHAEMLSEALPENLTFFGYFPKDSGLTIPERHLGLVQAQELEDLDTKLNLAASLVAQHSRLALPTEVEFTLKQIKPQSRMLDGRVIAVARDKAFSFIYQANLDLLVEMGAHIEYFSPIEKQPLPPCDAIYFPGGYPELYLDVLSEHYRLKEQVVKHVSDGKPILAECGGMLYLNNSLTGLNNQKVPLASILNANSHMQSKLAALGLVEGELTPNETLRGHTFHYSKTDSHEQILCYPISQRGRILDPVWQKGQVVASYIHWYFPSNPELVAKIFRGEL